MVPSAGVDLSQPLLPAGTLKAAFASGRICNGCVVATNGAIVRRDASLRSPLVCTLSRSTKVLCVDQATVPPRRHAPSRRPLVKRVRIVAPMQGWCSAKALRFEDRTIHLASTDDLIRRLGHEIKTACYAIDAAAKRRDETLLDLLREKGVIDHENASNLGTHFEPQAPSMSSAVDDLPLVCDRSQSAPSDREADNVLSLCSSPAAIEEVDENCHNAAGVADGIDNKNRVPPRRPEVVELDDLNFEKATRAVTGDAEDWLVFFVAPWCTYSKRIAPVIQRLSCDLTDYGVKVGRLDVTESPQIACRFGIRALPTITLLHAGSMFEFNGRRTTDALAGFARSGFESLPGFAMPPENCRQPNMQLSLPLGTTHNGYFPYIPRRSCHPNASMANRELFHSKNRSDDVDASPVSASAGTAQESVANV